MHRQKKSLSWTRYVKPISTGVLRAQVTYTFCYDFITLLVNDAQSAEFGRTEVLVDGLTRVRVLVNLMSAVGLAGNKKRPTYRPIGLSRFRRRNLIINASIVISSHCILRRHDVQSKQFPDNHCSSQYH